MAIPIPTRPNVRNCTHIKVTGQRCGSPALRGEFFCYFHTRVIKGVQQRVDMQLHSMALLEDCESIQLSLMHVVDGLLKGTLEATRARLIIQALRIAARNARNVRFDDVHYRSSEQPMVRQVPDYARQYLIEHPELGRPIASSRGPDAECGAGAPARKNSQKNEQSAAPGPAAIPEPAAKRRQNTAHGASRGSKPQNNPAPQERKNNLPTNVSGNEIQLPRDDAKERQSLQQAEVAMEGAERGNWRDLRAVLEFAGLAGGNKEAP